MPDIVRTSRSTMDARLACLRPLLALLSLALAACGAGAPPPPTEPPHEVVDAKPQRVASERVAFEVVERVAGLEHP